MRGTKSLLAHLDRIQNAIKTDVPNKVNEEVEGRAKGAVEAYAEAQHGSTDISVEPIVLSDNEWAIVASGETLLFIEFGTGIIYPHNNPIDHPYNYPGSWSVDHGQYLTDSEKLARYKGGWPLANGVISYGNPSANVMYQTGKSIRGELPKDLKLIIDKAVKS